jgi:hypothetical protein
MSTSAKPLVGSNAVDNLPVIEPEKIASGHMVRLADGRVAEIQSIALGSPSAIVAIQVGDEVIIESQWVRDLTAAGDLPPVSIKRSTIVRRWVDISSAHRKRTRPPGSEMLVTSNLVRGWEWPHPDVSEEPAFVRVEVEGNVNVGGGEVARWLVDDRVIIVTPQWDTVLLAIGPFEGGHYDLCWRYSYIEDALEAARTWDGEGEPPGAGCPEAGGPKWVFSAFTAGMMPAEGEEACPFCYQELGEEHAPFCPISEAAGLSMPKVRLDDVRSLV